MSPPTPQLRLALDRAFASLADSGYASLPAAQRTLVRVWSALGEIGNGGLEQYLFNSSGDWAGDTPGAFLDMGMPELAAILREAFAVFPAGKPSPDPAARRTQLDALPPSARERLDALTRAFLDAEADADRMLAAWVRAHRGELAAPDDA